MSNLACKRIAADIKNIKRNRLEDHNIHVCVDDEDMFKVKALIIGPEDTPYAHGFYFFYMEIPKDYPISPPKVKFINLNGNVRFHPNLYKCGKVCLSILNTWHGPGWTSVQTLSSILLSIQSIMNEHPIQNEPGWETEEGNKSKEYNNVIGFYNMHSSIIHALSKDIFGYEVFKDIMISYFVKNIKKYYKFYDTHKKLQGKKVKSGIYSMLIDYYDLEGLREKMDLLYSEYDNIISN